MKAVLNRTVAAFVIAFVFFWVGWQVREYYDSPIMARQCGPSHQGTMLCLEGTAEQHQRGWR